MSGVVLILFFPNYKVNTPALFLSSPYPFYTTPLRRFVLFHKIIAKAKYEKRPFVETQCLRLRDAKSMHKTHS
jgi:hypothetical protein